MSTTGCTDGCGSGAACHGLGVVLQLVDKG